MSKEVFTRIYEENLWASKESRSGSGSELKNTEVLRKKLSILLKEYNITTMLDIPCGDFNWMKEMDLTDITYIGADIVESIIRDNYINNSNIIFKVLDIIEDDLPKVDLMFVRDCLGHFSNANVTKALENIQKSGSTYLLTTSFTRYSDNPDILDGNWKCINLTLPPFSLTSIDSFNEECIEGYPHYTDKCMLLFKIN